MDGSTGGILMGLLGVAEFDAVGGYQLSLNMITLHVTGDCAWERLSIYRYRTPYTVL